MSNLLTNGDFTGSTYQFVEWGHTVNEVQLPTGWDLFSYDGGADFHRPETKVQPAHTEELTGATWKVFTTYSRHHYSLGQRVAVAVGTELKLTAWVYPWSSSKDEFGESVGGSYRTRVGIDAAGLNEPDSPYIVWSHEEPGLKAMDRLVEHTVVVTAVTPMVTVWLQGDCEWPVKHNNAFWDGAHLEALDTPEPPPGECACAELAARVAVIESVVKELCFVGADTAEMWSEWLDRLGRMIGPRE